MPCFRNSQNIEKQMAEQLDELSGFFFIIFKDIISSTLPTITSDLINAAFSQI